MYTPINGFTKAAIIKTIQTKMKDHKSINPSQNVCVYLADDGNRCAVGIFIPDGHPGLQVVGGSYKLFQTHPDLEELMPLDRHAMKDLQAVHDGDGEGGEDEDPRPRLIAWVNEHVPDEEE